MTRVAGSVQDLIPRIWLPMLSPLKLASEADRDARKQIGESCNDKGGFAKITNSIIVPRISTKAGTCKVESRGTLHRDTLFPWSDNIGFLPVRSPRSLSPGKLAGKFWPSFSVQGYSAKRLMGS